MMAKAKDVCRENKFTQLEFEQEANKIAEEDHLRYLLWIDPTRANAFLSKKVLLVEGPTEKALFAFMFSNPKGDFFDEKETANITVVDTVGKYHFYKFASLLSKFKLDVWCMYDTDADACRRGISHKILNEEIEKLKTSSVIMNSFTFTPSLEEYLGLVKVDGKPDVTFYAKLVTNEKKCRENENYKRIIEFVKSILEHKAVNQLS